MSHPPITVALVLSLIAGIATAAKLMPPRADVSMKPGIAALLSAASLRKMHESCGGYETLHILLRSASDAENFRRTGRCLETLAGAPRPAAGFGSAVAAPMR